MTQKSDLRQLTVLLFNEIIMIVEPCRREWNKSRFKIKPEKKICNMIACGGRELDMRIQISLNTFFPVFLKLEREIGNSKRSSSTNERSITTCKEMSHLEIKIVNDLTS